MFLLNLSTDYIPPFYMKLSGTGSVVDAGGSRRWRRRTSRLLGAVHDEGKARARSACNPNYCRNGGACQLDERQHSGFRCVCKTQYSGLRCDNGKYISEKVIGRV